MARARDHRLVAESTGNDPSPRPSPTSKRFDDELSITSAQSDTAASSSDPSDEPAGLRATSTEPYEHLLLQRVGFVDVVTINRPEKRNALGYRTYSELERAVRTSTARCLVVTATDPTFCSGDDVHEVMGGGERTSEGASRAPTVAPKVTPAAAALLRSDIPIIAAVNGAAVGWGMELAVMCDVRVASERARFGELFVLRGLCTDVAGIGRLASLVGRERATELVLTGDIIDAHTALAIGLVSRVVAHDELLATAMALATKLAERPPLAIAAIKRGLRLALDPDWDQLGEFVGTNLTRLFQTADHREGVRSFLEKRPPVFEGR